MCYLALSLSLSPTSVHAPPARPSVIYLFFLSARCGRGTFNSSGHNLTSVAVFPSDLKASRPSRRFCADGAVALRPEYQMSCRRFVWLHRGFACIVFPIRQTPLSGGSRHSCCSLLIPLLFRNRLQPQPSGSPPSERLREFWPHFPVTLKVTWLVDIGSLTQKCRHSLSKLCRAVGLKSAVPFLLLRS